MKYQAVRLRSCAWAIIFSFCFSETVHAHGFWPIFCDKCTSLQNNTRRTIDAGQPADALTANESELLTTIIAFEKGLNPKHPEKSRIVPKIIGHGSTSLGFLIPDWEHLLIRRLPGFPSYQAAKQHIFLVNEYRARLHKLMIQTTRTQLIALENDHSYGVVYVIQPFLTENQLSKKMLKKYGEPFKRRLLQKQADIARDIISYNIDHPDSAITIDIVNNNWEIFNFNPLTMEFEVRLNDLAQPLFKKKGQLAYDFYDQAFSIIYPLNLIVQEDMQKEFGELFYPRNLMMQALWGYDEPEPVSRIYRRYLWLAGLSTPRTYPEWAMDTVNDVLEFFNYDHITARSTLEGHQMDKSAVACLRLYREFSQEFRSWLGLTSNVYMNPGNISVEMYASDHSPSYSSCFCNAVKDVITELIYGAPEF